MSVVRQFIHPVNRGGKGKFLKVIFQVMAQQNRIRNKNCLQDGSTNSLIISKNEKEQHRIYINQFMPRLQEATLPICDLSATAVSCACPLLNHLGAPCCRTFYRLNIELLMLQLAQVHLTEMDAAEYCCEGHQLPKVQTGRETATSKMLRNLHQQTRLAVE